MSESGIAPPESQDHSTAALRLERRHRTREHSRVAVDHILDFE